MMVMSTVKLDSIDLADYILAKLGPMAHLKLQKLVYYVEAWHLAVFEEPLIDDNFKAWLHGPVSTKVWHHYKDRSMLNASLGITKERAEEVVRIVEGALDQDQIDLITDVLSEYGKESAYHLECLTHSEDPWMNARRGVPPGESSTNTISKESIKQFYAEKLGAV